MALSVTSGEKLSHILGSFKHDSVMAFHGKPPISNSNLLLTITSSPRPGHKEIILFVPTWTV